MAESIKRNSNIESFIASLFVSLDTKARSEFSDIEQFTLKRAMEACGMSRYPPLSGDPCGERCSGDMLCDLCGREYAAHPMDWRVIGYGDVPFLNVLCDGRRVKL